MKYIVTLTGPSLSGKSTLESLLVKYGFSQVISTTTRQPRPYEVDGQHYYFVSVEKFCKDLEDEKFVEFTVFNGDSYGATVEELDRIHAKGKPVVIVVDPSGKDQIRDWAARNDWKVLSLFMHCGADLTALRFVDRFVKQGVLGAMSDEYRDIALKTAYRRLSMVIGSESEWIRNALSYVNTYDSFVKNFSKATEEAVINAIVKIVQPRSPNENEPS